MKNMIHDTAIHLKWIGISVVLVCCAGLSTAAAVTLNPLDLDNFPDGWTVAGSESSVSINQDGDTSYLRIARMVSGDSAGGAIVFWGETESAVSQLGDFSGSVILRANSYTANNAFGIIVGAERMAYTGGTTTSSGGYYIGMAMGGSTGPDDPVLGVWKNPLVGVNNVESNAIVSNKIPSGILSAGALLLLEFEINNDTIQADVWLLDENDNKVGNSVVSISFTGEEAIEGYFGLMAGRFNGAPRYVEFRDVELQIIPEPSAVYLAVLISLTVLAHRLLRRKNRV